MSDSTLIQPNGRPRFGYFPETPDLINVEDFDYRTPMGKRQNRLRKWLDYNQFQYIGIVSDELLVGCALADFRYAGIAFVYTYEPASRKLTEFSTKVPLGRGFSLTPRPIDGTSMVETGGNRIRMIGSKTPRTVSLEIDLKSGLHVDAHFALDGPAPLQPMALCTQTATNGWVFTQKVAGVRATGTVSGALGTVDLTSIGAQAHYDYSVGYMRRETFWNWACFSGEADGHDVGLNLSCGVNETSFSENCVWIDGELIPTGLTSFEYDRSAPDTQPWRIVTNDGFVELDFEPEGIHRERLNLVVLSSNFKQVFGKFNGVIHVPGHEPIAVKNIYGFVEDQYAKW